METAEEVVVAPPYHINDLCNTVAKGKRTKRQRPHSPISFIVSNNNNRLSPSFSAAAASTAADRTTAEEEDTARCLILLSRGHFHYNPQLHGSSKQNNRSPQTAAERVGAATVDGGVYACKTCDRVFSSFQALGGHRTSHIKPKNEKKTAYPGDDSPPPPSKKKSPPSLSLQLSTAVGGGGEGGRQLPSPRTHECSYCGAEFTSGQALGGHMRRHRAAATCGGVAEPKKSRNGLSLDLNFPAPEDENEQLGCGSARREKIPEELVISAPNSDMTAIISLRNLFYNIDLPMQTNYLLHN